MKNWTILGIAAFLAFALSGTASADDGMRISLQPVGGQIETTCTFSFAGLPWPGSTARALESLEKRGSTLCTVDTGSTSTIVPNQHLGIPLSVYQRMPVRPCLMLSVSKFSAGESLIPISDVLACSTFKTEGVIGMDSLAHHTIVFDFPSNQIVSGVPVELGENWETFDSGSDNRIYMNAHLGDEAVRVFWDTGGGWEVHWPQKTDKLSCAGIVDSKLVK